MENEVFASAPMDAEIVFATGSKLKECVPLNALNVSLVKEMVNEDVMREMPQDVREHFKAEYRTAIVLDSMPYWWLKEKYNISFEKKDDEK